MGIYGREGDNWSRRAAGAPADAVKRNEIRGGVDSHVHKADGSADQLLIKALGEPPVGLGPVLLPLQLLPEAFHPKSHTGHGPWDCDRGLVGA